MTSTESSTTSIKDRALALFEARQYERAAALLELLAGVDNGADTVETQLLYARNSMELSKHDVALHTVEQLLKKDEEAVNSSIAGGCAGDLPCAPSSVGGVRGSNPAAQLALSAAGESENLHPTTPANDKKAQSGGISLGDITSPKQDVDGPANGASNYILTQEQTLEANRIATKCLLKLCLYKQCVTYAERTLDCVARTASPMAVTSAKQLENAKAANIDALCALARCTECTGGNTKKAAQLYKEALEIEPLCTEAVEALLGHRLLPPAELLELINRLQLPPECEPLRGLYKARIDTDASNPTEESGRSDPPCVTLLRAAKYQYRRTNLRHALRHTTELLKLQPFSQEAVTLHVAILVDMRETSKLFQFAHELVDKRPHEALSLYAVGCYYYLLCSYEKAGRFFSKATELAPSFPHAWIAYAHCYAQLEEGEQALQVYRRAQATFPGLHLCGIYLGMQYSRVHNVTLSMCFLEEARRKAPNDTLLLNEMAVLYMRVGRLKEAHQFFLMAYQSLPCPTRPSQYEDCILFNLGTVKRKLGLLPQAAELFSQYSVLRPNSPHAHCALGFTQHLMGNLKDAIQAYHASLAIKPDAFCRDMLDRAVADEYSTDAGGVGWGAPTPALPTGASSTLAVSPTPHTTMPPMQGATTNSRGVAPSQSPAVGVGRILSYH